MSLEKPGGESGDFVFIQLNEDKALAEIVGDGAGLETFNAIARLAILKGQSDPSPRGPRRYSLFSNPVGFKKKQNPDSAVRYLDDLPKIRGWLTPPDYGVIDRRVDTVLEAVNLGNRSTQSGIDEIEQMFDDKDLLKNAKQFPVFDKDGRKVRFSIFDPEIDFRKHDDELLDLHNNRLELYPKNYSSVTRDAVEELVPSGELVLSHMQLGDLYHTGSGGSPLLHETFGYLQGDRFVPVVTQLNREHPSVKMQEPDRIIKNPA